MKSAVVPVLQGRSKVVKKRPVKTYAYTSNLKQHMKYIVVSALIGLCAASYFAYTSYKQSLAPLNNPLKQSTPSQTPVEPAPKQSNPSFAESPTWIQNFKNEKDGVLNPLYWNVLVGPAENSNKEQQYYTANPSNIRIENGILRLLATKQPQPEGYVYGSARIETQGKKTFLYGRIDIEAKLPAGVGTWPAVWLLPATDTYANMSSSDNFLRYKNGGEIDVIEAVGFNPDTNYGVAHTASDLVLRSDGTGAHNSVNVPNSSTAFNKYTLLWTPTSLTFAVNDEPYFVYTKQEGANYKTWPFDMPFYLIANLAMGGTWGGLDIAHFPGNGIDDSALPTSLDIRSIYYYPYIQASIPK